jgi:hypothetical protein
MLHQRSLSHLPGAKDNDAGKLLPQFADTAFQRAVKVLHLEI